MAIENNVTVTLRSPLPKKAQKPFNAFLEKHGFSTEWDGGTVSLADLPAGKTSLMGRDVGLEEQQGIIKLAKRNRFSIIIHAEWHKDYESECKGSILAFDSTDRREIDSMATCGTGETLVTLADVRGNTPAELCHKFGLPADLLDKPESL